MESGEITRILHRVQEGNASAVDRLLPEVYDELRRLAQAQLGRERGDHTLQATALVHEAYLRLVDQDGVDWRNRAHFMAVASIAIRRILVDYARRRAAAKRGGDAARVTLSVAADVGIAPQDIDLIALDTALRELAQDKPDHAQVVEMRFFGGLTARESAEVLGVTERTVERRWRFARAWLYRRLEEGGSVPTPE